MTSRLDEARELVEATTKLGLTHNDRRSLELTLESLEEAEQRVAHLTGLVRKRCAELRREWEGNQKWKRTTT